MELVKNTTKNISIDWGENDLYHYIDEMEAKWAEVNNIKIIEVIRRNLYGKYGSTSVLVVECEKQLPNNIIIIKKTTHNGVWDSLKLGE